jgi:hypothetical protein
METRIWWRDKYVNVDPEKPPKDERQLISFLRYNNAAACFIKTGNAWRKITKQGSILYVSRTLYLLPLKEWLAISLNDNFVANMP